MASGGAAHSCQADRAVLAGHFLAVQGALLFVSPKISFQLSDFVGFSCDEPSIPSVTTANPRARTSCSSSYLSTTESPWAVLIDCVRVQWRTSDDRLSNRART